MALLDDEELLKSTISATPRNQILGLLSDFIAQGYDPRRTQQMQGISKFLMAPEISQTLDLLSYDPSGRSLFTGAGGLGGTTRMRPEALDALLTLAPMAGPAARLAGRGIMATKGLPVGASIKNVGKTDLVTGLPLNSDGTVTLFHHTNKTAAEQIAKSGRLKSAGEPSVYLTTEKATTTGYGDVAVPVRVKPSLLNLDDEFPSGRMDFRIDTGKPKGSVPVTVEKQSFQYPQQAALDLAQQRAALPVEQGGLGLPGSNTAEQRAAAMGGKDMVHFSRAGGDYQTLDSGKYAIAPFDAVGTHVGTPQAAMERFQNTVGYKVNNPNYANDELRGVTYPVTILGNKPLMNQNGMPFGEDDLSALLRQQGGHNYSDIQGGKMTYQDMNADLRKKLFEEQGYTSIPYYNEVEGKGSISYIVPPENIRSRFAAFDPFRRSSAIAATMGAAAPDLLAAQQDEEMRKLQQLGLLGMVAP